MKLSHSIRLTSHTTSPIGGSVDSSDTSLSDRMDEWISRQHTLLVVAQESQLQSDQHEVVESDADVTDYGFVKSIHSFITNRFCFIKIMDSLQLEEIRAIFHTRYSSKGFNFASLQSFIKNCDCTYALNNAKLACILIWFTFLFCVNFIINHKTINKYIL